MARKRKPDPPWKWIDDLKLRAQHTLAKLGIFKDARNDTRNAAIDCPLCGRSTCVFVRYSGPRRRLRITCTTPGCLDWVEE